MAHFDRDGKVLYLHEFKIANRKIAQAALDGYVEFLDNCLLLLDGKKKSISEYIQDTDTIGEFVKTFSYRMIVAGLPLALFDRIVMNKINSGDYWSDVKTRMCTRPYGVLK